jgi:predicted glycoside hydrolase/deacetylase ChbG (UPF0249 family)
MVKLIINADDYGISASVNVAIANCFQKKLIQRTTIMVNMEETINAVKMAYKGGFVDKVGLHLNLIEGQPLTKKILSTKLCNDDGYFDKNYFKVLKNRLYCDKETGYAISEEIDAQIRKYLSFGFKLKHMDSHEHVHNNFSIFFLLLPYLKKYDFHSIRLLRNIPKGHISLHKKIYKFILNTMVLKYNKSHGDLGNIKFFGSQSDVEKAIRLREIYNSNVELMIHPVMKEDCISDVSNEIGIREWLTLMSNEVNNFNN